MLTKAERTPIKTQQHTENTACVLKDKVHTLSKQAKRNPIKTKQHSQHTSCECLNYALSLFDSLQVQLYKSHSVHMGRVLPSKTIHRGYLLYAQSTFFTVMLTQTGITSIKTKHKHTENTSCMPKVHFQSASHILITQAGRTSIKTTHTEHILCAENTLSQSTSHILITQAGRTSIKTKHTENTSSVTTSTS